MSTRPGPSRTAQRRVMRKKRTYTSGLTAPHRPRRPSTRLHVVIGVLLLVLAAALVPTHLAEHAGVIQLMPRPWEDLLLGFPAAGILMVSGFISLIWR